MLSVSDKQSKALHGGDKRGGMTLSGASVKWQLKTTGTDETGMLVGVAAAI